MAARGRPKTWWVVEKGDSKNLLHILHFSNLLKVALLQYNLSWDVLVGSEQLKIVLPNTSSAKHGTFLNNTF